MPCNCRRARYSPTQALIAAQRTIPAETAWQETHQAATVTDQQNVADFRS